MTTNEKRAIYKRMRELEKQLADNNEKKLNKLKELYSKKKEKGLIYIKPTSSNFNQVKEKMFLLYNFNFNRKNEIKPFNLDNLKELKEIRNNIKKALSTKDISLIDNLIPLAVGISRIKYGYDQFTHLNFENTLNKVLKLSSEKKELMLASLLNRTIDKINVFNFQFEETQKKYINTLNKINNYHENLLIMKSDKKIKPKDILNFIKYNEYLFNNLDYYGSLLPDSHKIVKIDLFKENDNYGSTIKEAFIKFLNEIDLNKKNMMVINIENDFEILPVIKDSKGKHIDASYIMYLYKNSSSIDEFYKECESINLPKKEFNHLLLTMYHMVKEPNCISYIIDTEKKLNGIENILFVQNESNVLINTNSIVNDLIENSKKGDEYHCINNDNVTKIINDLIAKKIEENNKKENKTIEISETKIDVSDR